VWRIRPHQELGNYTKPLIWHQIVKEDWTGLALWCEWMKQTRVAKKMFKETPRQKKSGKAQNEMAGRCREQLTRAESEELQAKGK
jgi:hypothetical protein